MPESDEGALPTIAVGLWEGPKSNRGENRE